MAYDERIRLNDGNSIPALGLGTWLIDDADAARAVEDAVAVGYRHIYTAQAYGNETGVGTGVRECCVPRSELLVTTKVAAEHKSYETAAASIDESLTRLGLDHVDLLIIHSPQPWAESSAPATTTTTRRTSRPGGPWKTRRPPAGSARSA